MVIANLCKSAAVKEMVLKMMHGISTLNKHDEFQIMPLMVKSSIMKTGKMFLASSGAMPRENETHLFHKQISDRTMNRSPVRKS